jgi:hypothetical protein
MSNATARASARALPDETEPLSEASARIQAFGRAYARWLTARAQLEDINTEDEDVVDRTFVEKRAALRELFLMPAAESEAIWAKLAAFEVDLVREKIAGPAKDCILLLGLGSIKADLMNIGIKGGTSDDCRNERGSAGRR